MSHLYMPPSVSLGLPSWVCELGAHESTWVGRDR